MLKNKYIIPFLTLFIFCYSCKEKQKEEHLSICFTGDVLLDRGVREQINKKGLSFLLEDVTHIFQSTDATIINLECPVTKTISPINKKYIFRGDPEWLLILKEYGVTHAALANNHSMDQGRSGLEDTYNNLAESGIKTLGYGKNAAEANMPVFISKDGIEVALFNSVTIPLENWVYLEENSGVCQASISELSDTIIQLKKDKPNCFIIIILHWGIEFQKEPTIRQRKEAYQLVDAGADAIIGHHPHVLQKEEIYKDKPIFYSIGNFIFDQNLPDAKESMIIRLDFQKHKFSFKKYPIQINSCKPEIQ